MKHIVSIFACILVMAGCEGLYPPAEKDRQMVLCYIACHDNQLSDASRAAIDDITANGELPPTDDDSKVLLIYYHLADSVPVLSRFSRDESGQCIEDKLVQYPGNSVISVLSLNPTQIRQVWTDAQALYPSNRQSLMISTHGSGYLPAGYLSKPEDRLDRNEQVGILVDLASYDGFLLVATGHASGSGDRALTGTDVVFIDNEYKLFASFLINTRNTFIE